MHYRNGREAKNGDHLVQLNSNGQVLDVGVLVDAQGGNDYCNGTIAPVRPSPIGACLIDCLHVDDLAEYIRDRGMGDRPAPKADPLPTPPDATPAT